MIINNCKTLTKTGSHNLNHSIYKLYLKKETGKIVQEYIQMKVIDVVKEKIFDQRKSVSEIAYERGFRYPQHFAGLFKQHVGSHLTSIAVRLM